MSSTPEHPGGSERTAPEDAENAVDAAEAAAERAQRREAALKAHRRSRRWRGRALAAAAGAGAMVLVGGVAVVGSISPAVMPEVDGAAHPARLTASAASMVCPPAPRLPEGAAAGTDTEFSPVSTSAEWTSRVLLLSDLAGRVPGAVVSPVGAEPGSEGERLTPAQPVDLQQGAPATAGQDGVPVQQASVHSVPGGRDLAAGQLTTVEPLGGQAALASAVTGYTAQDGDLAGLAAADCQAPAHRHWLTGASTTLGTTSVLTLVNPSTTASTVDLDLLGADGPVEAPGARGIVLAPGESTSVVLAGLAPDQEHVAVRVMASGGAVTAGIQQHRLDGVTPAGVELIQPGAEPSATAVVPGVRVPGDAVLEELSDPAAGPSVLIAAPVTSGPTRAEVSVIGPDGEVDLPEPAEVDLAPGSAVRVPLAGVPRGEYTVTVSAEGPVVASARGLDTMEAELPEGGDAQPVDRAIMPAAAPLGLEQLVALPSHARSHLVLAAPDGGAVDLTAVHADGSVGQPHEQEVAAGRQVRLDVRELAEDGQRVAGLVITTTAGSVHAGLTQRSAQGISAVPVGAEPEQAAGIPVRVRP